MTKPKKNVFITQTKSSTVNHYQQLTPEKRGEIEIYLIDSMSKDDILSRLHRRISTILREAKRGIVQQCNHDYLFVHYYYADKS
ncbi:helix-turn-helix domain-containing protein [Paucilactobacillus suebicus]|uniref:helix-turn-helix domain-containing protein n=1 Tax=Paucilactobacillus suebicus TaxID=152335 RepID=UPI0002490CBE|nr:helix-turn-helix domain-containing protein [Paucilactobacillus suebicus]